MHTLLDLVLVNFIVHIVYLRKDRLKYVFFNTMDRNLKLKYENDAKRNTLALREALYSDRKHSNTGVLYIHQYAFLWKVKFTLAPERFGPNKCRSCLS